MVTSLKDDALAIWSAAVRAVDSARLVQQAVVRDGSQLILDGHGVDLTKTRRLLVVGGGKAGAGMAAGLEAVLGEEVLQGQVTGLLNVPADCVRLLQRIELHAGRPAGVNEPTAEGVAGVQRMLDLVGAMTDDDVCLVLLSGGGSALLPAPVDGISLADKLAVTRWLMHHGASIEELNAVRGCLSRFKGGGLIRAMPAGRCFALIISDVIGDPLSVIASGPTVDEPLDPRLALDVLHRRTLQRGDLPESIWTTLEQKVASHSPQPALRVTVHNHVIGNNRTALDAAAAEAQRLGYVVAGVETDQRGEAREVGEQLAERAVSLRSQPGSARGWCWLSGGEPVVTLVPSDRPRRGGRNQELALAALQRLSGDLFDDIVIVSGGTDGEDGPTDAAGAVCAADVWQRAVAQRLDPAEFLAINNAYPFFDATGGLLRTGPTHTNVMDVRVALVSAT
jgi:glycerate 2-kinase